MWRWLLPLAIAFLLVLVAIILWQQTPAIRSHTLQNSQSASIGGEYALVNQEGQTFTSADLQGSYQLVYFGYSFCPDICPTGLLTITDTLHALGDDAARVTPVFITIDPARDTPDHLQSYMQNFHPRFVALSGSDDAISQAAKAYKVYYARSSSTAPNAEHYLMDHSSYIYFMSPDGHYLKHFRHDTPVDEIVKAVTVELARQSTPLTEQE